MVQTENLLHSAYATSIARTRDEINTFLDTYYAARSRESHDLHAHYGRLWDSLKTTHLAGGKRIRPFLALFAYEAFGGTDRIGVLPACASVELLHAAMLVHDDIIDRDEYRHGTANVSGIYQHIYQTQIPEPKERKHFVDSAALLGGDILISEAFKLTTEANVKPLVQIAVIKLLSEAVYRVAGGELLDYEAGFYDFGAIDAVRVAELKTAYYSFSLPLEIGATLAEAPEEVKLQLREIGMHIGVAFQLSDDLLGMYGSTDETGKPVGNDLREGKRSLLMERGLALAEPKDRQQLLSMLGNQTIDTDMVDTARSILTRCGAQADVEARMHAFYEQAVALIDSLPISTTDKKTLEWIAQWSIWRRS